MVRRGAEEGRKVKDQRSTLRSIIIITFDEKRNVSLWCGVARGGGRVEGQL